MVILSLSLLALSAPEPLLDEQFDPPGQALGLPDPKVFDRDGWHYLTGTGGRMARTRTWAPDDIELFALHFDFGAESARGAAQIWGFTLWQSPEGVLHGYGTVHYGRFRTAIAHFVPATGEEWTEAHPITRWVLDRMLVGDFERGSWAYDQEIYTDADGRQWLVYNAGLPTGALGENVSILARRMLDPVRLADEPPRVLLAPEGLRSEDRNHPGGMQLVESVQIQQFGERYCLFYSVGDFDRANYKVGAAWSDELIPPPGQSYRKVLVPDPADLWGSGRGEEVLYLLQSQRPEWPNWVGDRLSGPGIASIVTMPDGAPRLLFHARHAGHEGLGGAGRYLWTLPVTIAVDARTPMAEWIRPVLD